jgi:hypothetical protein
VNAPNITFTLFIISQSDVRSQKSFLFERQVIALGLLYLHQLEPAPQPTDTISFV